MKRILLLLGILCLWLPLAGADGQQPVSLTLLHTNDVHAHLLPNDQGQGGVASTCAILKKIKGQRENVLILDAGDMITGTPVSTLFLGTPIFDVYNTMPYDAAVLGNHEFDHGWSQVAEFLNVAKFPILCANIRRPDGQLMTGKAVKRFKKGDVMIDVVGISPPDLPTLAALRGWEGLQIEEGSVAVRRYLDQVETPPDLLVVLSHMGLEKDLELAQAVPEIDIIVGGHSHTVLEQARKAGDTLIVQAGSYGRYVGQIDIWLDPETGKIDDSFSHLIPVRESEYGKDPQTEKVVEKWESRVRKLVDVKIGDNDSDLGRSDLRQLISEVLKTQFQADLGYQNSGGVRANLAAGPILKRNIWTMLPFGNTVTILTVNRNQLGVLDLQPPSGQEHQQTFRVVTNSYIADQAESRYHLPKSQIERRDEVVRDVIIDYIQKNGAFVWPQPAAVTHE